MARFFIDRPILAWVFAIFISIAGLIALPFLPVAQYPKVAPPQLSITTSYPGASPQDIYQGVTRQIEEELNGVEHLSYFESTSDTSGAMTITATFAAGTDIDQASVDVQNAIRRVEPRLPQSVKDQGITVEEASSGFLMFISLTSTDGKTDEVALGDYLNRNVIGELRRLDGVGRAQLFASQRAMRIWIDPDKMVGLNLTASDISAAISAQNAQVAAGQIGAAPNPISQDLTATVLVKGQLTDSKEFGDIVLRANADGSNVRLRDVARIEEGSESYSFSTRLNGQPSAAIAIQLSSTGNAVNTSNLVKAKMEELSRFFPDGVEYSVPYDTSPFVSASIEKVAHTLAEAVALVFIVMLVFLQSFRYTIIPTLVVPVALLGTLAVMFAAGFSINVLTMFAMVLAIGILVDDAIVVVENVERLMAVEGLSPKEATKKAMRQITGAILGITLVLSCVFVPMAFFPGSTGIIYRQFSLTMVVSILFSAFLALSLTPALCATFLKPIKGHHEKKGIAGWFNRNFDRLTSRYARTVEGLAKRSWRVMAVYIALVVGLGYLFVNLPSSFVPDEDQGFLIVDVQGPPEASRNRTVASLESIEAIFKNEPAVANVVAIQGFSFSGQGPNAALVFVTLKDWAERGAGNSVQEISNRVNMQLFALKDATSFALSPPPIEGFGTTNGFTFRLQDRGGKDQAALTEAAGMLLGKASGNPIIAGIRPEGMPDSAQLVLVIDREKANTFGVAFADINSTITANLGSSYVNDFPNSGRMQRVIVQAQDKSRLQAEDLMKLKRPQCERRHGAALILRGRRVAEGAGTDRRLQRLSLRSHFGRSGAGIFIGRGDCRNGTAGLRASRRFRLRMDRPVAGGAQIGIAGTVPLRPQHPFRLPAAVGAIRELVDPAVGDAGRAARGHRLRARGDEPRHVQRHLLQGRPDRDHRSLGEERHPDRRIRQGRLCRGQIADGCRDRRRSPALSADHHDLARLHLGRGASGDCHRAKCCQPECDRHRRARRHDLGDGAGDLLRSRLLRLRAASVEDEAAGDRERGGAGRAGTGNGDVADLR